MGFRRSPVAIAVPGDLRDPVGHNGVDVLGPTDLEGAGGAVGGGVDGDLESVKVLFGGLLKRRGLLDGVVDANPVPLELAVGEEGCRQTVLGFIYSLVDHESYSTAAALPQNMPLMAPEPPRPRPRG